MNAPALRVYVVICSLHFDARDVRVIGGIHQFYAATGVVGGLLTPQFKSCDPDQRGDSQDENDLTRERSTNGGHC